MACACNVNRYSNNTSPLPQTALRDQDVLLAKRRTDTTPAMPALKLRNEPLPQAPIAIVVEVVFLDHSLLNKIFQELALCRIRFVFHLNKYYHLY